MCLLISARRFVLTRMESGVSTSMSAHLVLFICLVWSLSDLWKAFFPKPSKGLSTLTEEEKLEFEFWGLLDCPSACFPSHIAGLAGVGSVVVLTFLRERCWLEEMDMLDLHCCCCFFCCCCFRACFSAFLLCFCDGEMTLPAGMVGDGQPDWGEDGCDSLDDTFLFHLLFFPSLLLPPSLLLLLFSELWESD